MIAIAFTVAFIALWWYDSAPRRRLAKQYKRNRADLSKMRGRK